MTQEVQSNVIPSSKQSNMTVNILRIIVGVLFIFSGLIKANDPIGLAFKMQEFFSKWELTGLHGATYTLAIIIILFEILAGVAILIGYATRIVSILLIALMVFFLFLTGYAVYYESSTGNELKCGCFGDCIPLTAWQSFWKDVILLVMTIYLFIKRSFIQEYFSKKLGSIIMIATAIIVSLLVFLAIRNLPFIDCLPFKKGNNIAKLYSEKNINDKVELSYEFTIEGKKVIKSNDEFMNDPSLHSIPYDRVIENIIEKAPSHAMIMNDYVFTDPNTGIDFAPSLFNENTDGYYFIWYIRDVKSMNKDNIDRLKTIHAETLKGTQAGIIIISASPLKEVREMLQEIQLPIAQVFIMNEVSIKTTIRSNPGLVLFNKGKVLGKWSPANYPKGYTLNGENIELQ